MKCARSILWALFLLGITANLSFAKDPAQKGDELLKAMSQKLAVASSFSFNTAEIHDGVKRNGQKFRLETTREVLVRRPNGFWTKYSGGRDLELWYDGKLLTGVSTSGKVYVQEQMPPTLDEAMDLLATKFNLDLPMSDVLYSSPYDAFIDKETKGGYAGKQSVSGTECALLIYSGSTVDWQLWINESTSLPCRLEMTYKKQPGRPFYRITFSNWNLAAKISENAFTHKIPDGFSQIPILQRVKKSVETPQTQTAPSKKD